MNKLCRGLISALLFISTAALYGAPILNEEHELRQPDGSHVKVIISGDEFYQVVETPDGYTLVRDSSTQWICYAKLSSDGKVLISTGVVYNPRGASLSKKAAVLDTLPKHLRIDKESVLIIRKKRFRELNNRSLEDEQLNFAKKALPKVAAATIDTVYGVTILIDFPDQKSAVPIDSITNFLNMVGYKSYKNNGSIRDFFYDISSGKLVYIQRITPFITAKNKKSYYDRIDGSGYAGSDELINEILNTLKTQGTFDFSTATTKNKVLRAVNMLYAGTADAGWAQGLWPHSDWINFSINGVIIQRQMLSDIESRLTLGGFCHENGHMLCDWPDLYAYDDHSAGAGEYDLMSSCGSTNPIPPNAFLRSLEGWTQFTAISKDSLGKVYRLPSNSDMAYFYSGTSTGSTQELFCIEARRKAGRYTSIPDTGLLIWHIDKAGDNTETGKNDYAVPEQADGKFDLENNKNSGGSNDLFHAGYATSFNDSTTPSAKWHNGKPSGIQIADISRVADTMMFTFGKNITKETKEKNFSKNENILEFDAAKKVIRYAVPNSESSSMVKIRMDLFGLDGKLVRTIVNEPRASGKTYSFSFNRTNKSLDEIPSGNYLCKLTMNEFQISKLLIFH